VRHGLTLALEMSRTGLCLFGGDGGPVFSNSAFAELLGFGPGEEVSWRSFQAKLGGAVGPGEEVTYWSSEERFLRVRLSVVESGERLASVDDLTGQERERATRDRFMAEVVAAQEREARRLSELLHDDAVQQLTALGLQLELAAQTGNRKAVEKAAATASGITVSLRRLVVELHPAVLESQGLSAAIEASAASLRAQGTVVEVRYFEHRLPPESELVAYRLVQEALANVLKHARARRVEVELSLAGEILRGRVTDDGIGFEPERIESAVGDGHLGLHLARERVEMSGGRFLLECRPGAGTIFSFELPVVAHKLEPVIGAAT
jgi:two-component system, NarL family, sensor histidine kinase UhpB